MIDRYINQKYRTSPANLPEKVGDRYYGADHIRDWWYMMDRLGLSVSDLAQGGPATIISGGFCSQGSGHTIDITPCIGIGGFQAEVPDDFSSFPPTKQTQSAMVRIASTQQTNLALSSVNTDGVTSNYVKLRYKETDEESRQRAKSTGTWSYVVSPSFEFVIDDVVPLADDLVLDEFTSDGASLTFIRRGSPRFNSSHIKMTANETIDPGTVVGISSNGKVEKVNLGREIGNPVSFHALTIVFLKSEKLSETKYVLCYRDNGTGEGKAIIADVSGTTPTFGSAVTFSGTVTDETDLTILDSSSFLVSYRSGSSKVEVIAASVSGTTPTFGSSNSPTANNANTARIANLNDSFLNRFVITYQDETDSTKIYLRLGSWSGTTISWEGGAQNIVVNNAVPAQGFLASKIVPLTEERFALFFNNFVVIIQSIGAGDFIYGSITPIGDATSNIDAAKMSDERLVIVIVDNADSNFVKVFFVDVFEFNPIQRKILPFASTLGQGGFISISALSEEKFVVSFKSSTFSESRSIVFNFQIATGVAQNYAELDDNIWIAVSGESYVHRSLAPGSIYYTNDGTSISTSPAGRTRLGQAKNENTLILQPEFWNIDE